MAKQENAEQCGLTAYNSIIPINDRRNFGPNRYYSGTEITLFCETSD